VYKSVFSPDRAHHGLNVTYLLQHLLTATAARFPDKVAIRCDGEDLSYSALEQLSNSLAAMLREQRISRGDRVGIYTGKCISAVVAMFGVLKAGACYVPLDTQAPLSRLGAIVADSGMSIVLTTKARLGGISPFLADGSLATVVLLDDHSGNAGISLLPKGVHVVPWIEGITRPSQHLSAESLIEVDPAYILYTSGSTGSPKGVMISHRASLTFVNWASAHVRLQPEDRVSNHAGLHFDLSVFDIFAAIRVGATVVMVPDGATTFPVGLAELIERERISVWYSVPSALMLLMLYGDLATHDLSCCRTVIFAGEVFPVKYLQQLMSALPHARLLNWYGPTETNVCTSYEVRPEDAERSTPIPIGRACANTEVFAIDDHGSLVTVPGEVGELYVRGPSIMQGYWGDSQKSQSVLVRNPFQPHFDELIYRSGDMVSLSREGEYLYVGRRDGMIKTRGYRVELGEIEACLHRHPDVKEVAVLPVPDDILGNRLRAVVALHDLRTTTSEDLVAHCRRELPRYMVPDLVELLDSLPKTSTGKTDRALLTKNFLDVVAGG
jgi:amino acid adenylation domain-containing protein